MKTHVWLGSSRGLLTVRLAAAFAIAAGCQASPVNESTPRTGSHDSAVLLSRSGWVATASPASTTDVPANALDGNAATRFSSGVAQANGQWFQVNMGSAQSFNRIDMDSGSSTGDYARSFDVFVSNDGTSWGSRVANGTGSAQLVSLTFADQFAKYVRVVQTGSAGNWWSIHEFNVYNSKLDRTGWTATASPASTTDVPANALDGNTSTRFSSGAAQVTGQWLSVDMKATQNFVRVDMDSGSSTGDYARSFDVFVSSDGTNWGTRIATGTGSAQLVSISFAQQSARYLKIVQTGSAGNWWSIHELNVYNSTGALAPGTCATDANCTSSQYCASGTCASKLANGATCTGGNQCTSGYCAGVGACGTAPSWLASNLTIQNVSATGPATWYGLIGVDYDATYPAPASAGTVNVTQLTISAAPQGNVCTRDWQCGTGFCTNGYCCNARCNDGCDSCNQSGSLGTCRVFASGTVCAAATGLCGQNQTCNGTANTCPTNTAVRPAGTLCRAAAGPCDVDDRCDGVSTACPDKVLAQNTACDQQGHVCDGTAATCNGSSGGFASTQSCR